MTAPTTFNATEYLLGRHLLNGAGARTAVVSAGRTRSYRELDAEVRLVAGALRELGVRPEERVLMCMTDDVEMFATILAAMYIGAVAVPTSTMLTGPELGKLVADSRARVVFGSGQHADVVRAAVAEAPDVRHVVFVGDHPGALPTSTTGHTWEQFLRGGSTESSAENADSGDERYHTWPESQALWLYTSGTTGTPKAAMHRHVDIKAVAHNYGEQVLGITAEDRCLSVAKLFFAYGIGNSMFLPLSVGATVLLEPGRPSPELLAERAAADGATLLFGTPSFWGPLLSSDVADDSFSSVRQGVSAGEALPARMFQGMLERFGVEVLDGIGSTELLHIFISNRPNRVHPGSSGTPVPGYEVEIRDERGQPIEGVDQPGELYVRGDSAAIGYWCRAEVSRQVFQGDWMRTGDTYLRNSDGTFSCLGRSGDMLKAGGIWVAPGEVEDRLLAHPDVSEVVVVGVPDSDALDKPVACVVPVPGARLGAAELIEWCRQELAAFKRPRAVVEMTELPKTATGKIRRNVLRETVSTELAERWRSPESATPMRSSAPAESAPN